MNFTLRPVQEDDLPALTDIYNHYVSTSNATFDIDTFTVVQRAAWLSQFNNQRHQCWVASTQDGEPSCCVAYACSLPFKVKKAYELSVETSIYVHPDYANQGLGRLLYKKLFTELSKTDLHRCYAGIAQPNPASVNLHEKFGFKKAGHYKEVGWKFEQYWDVVWMEKGL